MTDHTVDNSTGPMMRPPPARMGGSDSMAGDNIDLDVRKILLMLWRRRMIIVLMLIIGLSLAFITIGFITPIYKAKSLILIESREDAGSLKQELSAYANTFRLDSTLVLNEMEVIRSRGFIQDVVLRLNLMADPEFNPKLKASGQNIDALSGEDGQGFKSLSIYNTELENLPPDVLAKDIDRAVTLFQNKLEVRTIPGSYAIQIIFGSESPQKAALIANTLADYYIEKRLEEKFNATQKVTDWLDKRLTDLREQVRSAEAAVEQYRQGNNITEGIRAELTAEQMSELNSQLVSAKAKMAEAAARLAQMQSLDNQKIDLETSPDVLRSDFIQRLKLNEAGLQSQIEEASRRYGERHPIIIKLNSQIAEVRGRIRNEMRKITASLQNELNVAKARVEALQIGIEEVEGEQNIENEAMIKLRELEREASSSRLIFDTFLETYKRSDDQEELQEPEATVISYAAVPLAPAYPNKLLILSLSSTLSLFLGIGLVIIREKLDNTFRSANQLEEKLGYPCYSLIPRIEDLQKNKPIAGYIMSKPGSVLAETVRTLRMVLKLRARNGKNPKVVSVTSSFPGEGKTTTSAWMASLAAKSGEKVIVIDCDLRRPSLHKVFNLPNDMTLVEYLTGKNSLEEIVQKDSKSGAHMIFARSIPHNALDLISSDKMKDLVVSLSKVYDLVILDTPACLAVSDARMLAMLSDQTLYLVNWDKTPREIVYSGIKQFYDINYDSLAFVLSNVDVKRHVRYGYGDTVYYYGRYKEYYSE